MRATLISLVVLATVTMACSSDAGSDADGRREGSTITDLEPSGEADEATVADSLPPAGSPPAPPELPRDFTWSGRYLVPDLDVDVPFTWEGADGDFQMIAGGEDEPIHFTNLVHDGHLYTLTYEWPDVPRNPCSYVGPYSVDEFNEGLADAAHVGRETLHGAVDRLVEHHRSVGVVELPAGLVPELEGAPVLRLPIMSGDIYVDADDHTVFRKVLHFGLQNLYDPDLDEWIEIDETDTAPGNVELPEECARALAESEDAGTD